MPIQDIKNESTCQRTSQSFRRKPESGLERSGFRVKPGMTKDNGSALILVVIVTVLLSVIGIMFVMTMRIREMTTANVADDRDMDTAVGAVAAKVETVLLQDLFGTNLASGIINGGGNESYDSTGASDRWLANLEPTWINDNGTPADPTDDNYQWDYVTNLYGTLPIQNKICGIVEDYQKFTTIVGGKEIPMTAAQVGQLPSDADGDGVADSMWAKLPNISTSRGKPVFAAVRIIDHCAMLNLNNAFCFYQDPMLIQSPFTKPWYLNSTVFGGNVFYGNDPITPAIERDYTDGGRYLSELNYYPFLRGSDLNFLFGWYNLLVAKRVATIDGIGALTVPYPLPDNIHNNVLMNYENPGANYSLFDIGDELEIRNRFIVTSKTVSRFERSDVANFTLDSGGGLYAVLETPVDDATAFNSWKAEMNPANFDPVGTGPNPGYYDRRHVCTFYSFDRNIRSGTYLLLDKPIADYRQANPAIADVVENLFRPLKNQPIDLRAMTDLTNLDNIVYPGTAAADLVACHRNILHLLYAFREREILALSSSDPNALIMAARKAAQQVANIIDYSDDNTANSTGPFGFGASSMDGTYGIQINTHPTFINEAIIDAMLAEVSLADSGGALLINPAWLSSNGFDVTGQPAGFGLPAGEVVYGYERQPFISEVYCDNSGSGVTSFAVELVNPYDTPIDLVGWNIKVGTQPNVIPLPAGTYVVPAGSSLSPGRLTIYGGAVPTMSGTGISVALANFGLGTPSPGPSPMAGGGNLLRLQRPDPVPANSGKYLTVDSITEAQRVFLSGTNFPPTTPMDTSRKDTAWGFVNNLAYPGAPATVTSVASSLGDVNIGVAAVGQKGYQLPVDDGGMPIDRLADFQKITWVDPNGLTGQIAIASEEGEIRYDSQVDMDLLHYVCTLSRGEKGIPGRININTAPLHVIAAAIPPQLVDPNSSLELAAAIIEDRPYAKLTELLEDAKSPHAAPFMKKYANSAVNVGDQSIDNDLEERDWIFNRLSNIFTVRSDTFTAYILVRLGTDGPQRRMIAIFDRSNCWTKDDKPRLVALHPVPDPR